MGMFSNVKRKPRRRLHERFGSDKYSRPGLAGIDLELEKLVDFTNRLFIKAGAFDSYSQNNTCFLKRFNGGRGIFTEGISELFEKCKKDLKKAASTYGTHSPSSSSAISLRA